MLLSLRGGWPGARLSPRRSPSPEPSTGHHPVYDGELGGSQGESGALPGRAMEAGLRWTTLIPQPCAQGLPTHSSKTASASVPRPLFHNGPRSVSLTGHTAGTETHGALRQEPHVLPTCLSWRAGFETQQNDAAPARGASSRSWPWDQSPRRWQRPLRHLLRGCRLSHHVRSTSQASRRPRLPPTAQKPSLPPG